MRTLAGANQTWRAADTMSTPQLQQSSGRPTDAHRLSLHP
jgi:hypothetical protein